MTRKECAAIVADHNKRVDDFTVELGKELGAVNGELPISMFFRARTMYDNELYMPAHELMEKCRSAGHDVKINMQSYKLSYEGHKIGRYYWPYCCDNCGRGFRAGLLIGGGKAYACTAECADSLFTDMVGMSFKEFYELNSKKYDELEMPDYEICFIDGIGEDDYFSSLTASGMGAEPIY